MNKKSSVTKFRPAAKKISDVFTIIWKGRQKVGFVVEDNARPVFLTPENVEQNTRVGISEVEILIGSHIRPVFYKKGQRMFNGVRCLRDNMLIKDFWITPSGSIQKMRRERIKAVPLLTIKHIDTFVHHDKKLVAIEAENGKEVVVHASSLLGLTKIDPNDFDILVGSYIAPEYYQPGEKMAVGGVCRKPNTIVKSLNLRFRAKITEMIRQRIEELEREKKRLKLSGEYKEPGHQAFTKYASPLGYDDDTIDFGFWGDASNLWDED